LARRLHPKSPRVPCCRPATERPSIATGGLDALPHNGAVITLLAICRLAHRQSYRDVFVVAVRVRLVALAAVVTPGAVVGWF